MKRILTSALLLLAAMTGALAQSAPANLPYHSVYGRLGAVPGDTGPGQAIPFLNLKQALGFTIPTIAALKAMVAPTTNTSVYVQGYSLDGDGGEGWFVYNTSSSLADDGGTTFIPNSAPAKGRWQRLRRSIGSNINVRWFGCKGDGATSDAACTANALALAIASKSGLYFPASSGCYMATITPPDATSGLRIFGDEKGYPILSNDGSCIRSSDPIATINVTASSGGVTNNIDIDHLKVLNTGTGDAVRYYNINFFKIEKVIAFSQSAVAFNIQGSANWHLDANQGYSNSGVAAKFGNGAGALTNVGPGVVTGDQYAVQGNNTGQAIAIEGEPLSLVFDGMQYQCSCTATQAISLDGSGSGIPTGNVTFIGLHGESNYNLAGTFADIAVGATHPFGSVTIEGGNSWGHGDGSHPARDFIRLVAANSVSIKGYTVSNLGFTGYTRSMVRVESSYAGAYNFQNLVASISGANYSDATAAGRLTGVTGDISSNNQSYGSAFSLSGTLTPAALSGDVNDYNPTGQSSATVLRIDGGASSRNITGFAGGIDGRLLTVINIGATNPVVVKNESASSAAANRMAVGLDITIDTNKSLTLRYDGTSARWRPWDSIYSSVSVPISRIINTTSPITGGGDLSVDRTFACATCVTSSGGGAITGTAPVAVSAAGAVSLNTNGISNSLFRQSAALSLVGRSANSTGNVADISAVAGSSCVFLESASSLSCGQVATAGIANNAVDNTKIRQGVARSVVGVTGNATANVADIQLGASQFLGVNASGTVLAGQTMSGDGTLSGAALTISKTGGVAFAPSATTDTTTQSNVAFTGLSAAAAAADADTLPVNQGAGNLKQTFAAIKAWVKSWIAKADVGLGNVDNTSDATKNAAAVALTNKTSFNKMAITAPATSSTLAVADGKTATVSNTITLTGTDGITVPFGTRTRCVILSTAAATCSNGGSQANNGTYTTPANVKYIVVREAGGGGGGQFGNGGSVSNATAGGNTTFSTFTANGGGAGGTVSGGAGGTSSGGSINLTGGDGGSGVLIANNWGGVGGANPLGGAGTPGPAATAGGGAAKANTGGGGGGGASAATASSGGGGGAGGYLEGVITAPSATYSYAVGAAGAAGVGSVNGGAGSAGMIIVDEFYQ